MGLIGLTGFTSQHVGFVMLVGSLCGETWVWTVPHTQHSTAACLGLVAEALLAMDPTTIDLNAALARQLQAQMQLEDDAALAAALNTQQASQSELETTTRMMQALEGTLRRVKQVSRDMEGRYGRGIHGASI